MEENPLMPDQVSTQEQPEQVNTEQPEEEQGDPEPLGDAGKKALDSERRARKAAEKELQATKARIQEFEAERLTKEELAQQQRDEAAARAAKAEAEALRWRIAAKHGITDDDAELFLTGTDEETLTRQAERFNELSTKPAKGTHVPGVGNKPPTSPTLAEQIQAAEAAGDAKLAVSLKARQMAELVRNQR
jgi:hypothetical protein